MFRLEKSPTEFPHQSQQFTNPKTQTIATLSRTMIQAEPLTRAN